MDVREETIDTGTDDGDMAVVVTAPADAPAGGGTWPTVVLFLDAQWNWWQAAGAGLVASGVLLAQSVARQP